MLFERESAMQTFWGFYITVSIGLLAFLGSSQKHSRLFVGLLSFVFIAFAFVNASVMLNIAKQRQYLYAQLDVFAASRQAASFDSTFAVGIKQVSQPPNYEDLKIFHIVTDIAMLIAIWLITLYTKRE